MKFTFSSQASSNAPIFIYLKKNGIDAQLSAQLDEHACASLRQLTRKGENLMPVGKTWKLLNKEHALFVYALGDEPQLSSVQFSRLMRGTADQLDHFAAPRLQVVVDNLHVEGVDNTQLLRRLGCSLADAFYKFDIYKSSHRKKQAPPHVVFVTQRKVDKTIARELAAVTAGMAVAKDLANMPSNECTPSYLARQAKKMAIRHKQLKCTVLGERELRRLGMNAYLAVAQGSKQPPQFILMEYKGGPLKQKPIVFLGKGMTFDSGGISLKPSSQMDEMKYDMAGAASVFGVMQAILALTPKINVIAAVAAAENMPGENAYKPGDIITTMAGKTVEVLNTDAEGRMVLCDALTYLKKYEPRFVLDMATLTGACVIALGNLRSGFFANDENLAVAVEEAATAYNDGVWRLPLDAEYKEGMKSNFADIAHIGGRAAGAITAACFLNEFTADYAWGHLDIAGTAWHGGARKGATGRPVPLLTQLVLKSVTG